MAEIHHPEYIAIGKFVRTRGTRGHLLAVPYSELPDRFLSLSTVYVETPLGMHGFVIEEVQIRPQGSVIKLKGVDTREAAAELVPCELWVPREQQIALPEDTYFIHDLIGLSVYDVEQGYVGELVEVIQNTGNDVYVVQEGAREVLIPAVGEFIKEVNLSERKMVVRLIEGMREEDAD
ncbi:MAG: 16S rRNA processing protein RimM [Calditrichaeota bacterium]|nr:MAG: 16S rRNA processing protein RimM [Calditrichota bacterium]